MFQSLLSRSKNSAIRRGKLYVGAQCTIVAVMHQNLAGIYYEQSAPRVTQGQPEAESTGRAFREAFDRFSSKDANLAEFKRSDWPVFKASGLRAVKEFERLFRVVNCVGINASNSMVRASVAHPMHPGIEMSVSFNPLLVHEVIGTGLMQLIKVANACFQ